MYSLNDYGRMIADTDRFAAYEKAIANTVRPGDAVAEIGCGPGVFTLLACRAGARRVFAIETEDCIEFARQLGAVNGLAERIEFFHSDSRNVQLPERMNVIISDVRGSLPFFGHAIRSIEDARRRFLASGGHLIPLRDTLKAAVIETSFYSKLVSPWSHGSLALDLSPSLPPLLNETYKSHFSCEELLTEPHTWTVLNYRAGAQACAAANLSFLATRSGTAHGVCLWFDTELVDGIGYSSQPSARKNVYGQVFLPWLQPVPVREGQSIHVQLQANLVGDDYIWCWNTTVPIDANGARHCFKQSTFQGANLTLSALRRRAADYVPSLSEEGRADRFLLQAMDGKASLQQIAESAARNYPKIFPRWGDALRRAAELSAKLSR